MMNIEVIKLTRTGSTGSTSLVYVDPSFIGSIEDTNGGKGKALLSLWDGNFIEVDETVEQILHWMEADIINEDDTSKA